ncbi:piggyBac transposable element-derived protein 4-like [Diabrotica virgifera virgifera]|uniref:PiggyBac transposable element-derived protein domain-containing protein n=1 Tax=Diabrotica virgifera virgifera TaxID=50390 RepID=A0ABM5KBA9_DIAVI|nr:piggyBac transposable element-derived protein 4-like [Diabrotica virgifera virgifera]
MCCVTMSKRSRKIVELALRDAEMSGDESDPFSSLDSDLDPMFLPTSDEEILSSSDFSDIEASSDMFSQKITLSKPKSNIKRKLQSSKITSKKLCTRNVLEQPSCSTSLLPDDASEEEEEVADATATIPFTATDDNMLSKNLEREQNNISSEQLEEFFDVETLAQTQLADTDDIQENEVGANQNVLEHTWTQPIGNHHEFEYSAEDGLCGNYAAILINDLSPYKCFRTFVDDEIIDEIVNQTNLYATQILCDSNDITNDSRLQRWVPTDKKEMIRFLGIVAYMGLVKMPSLEKYWSNDDLYKNVIIPKTMSRNRFQLLLRMWHFSDNERCPEGDRLFKVQPLLEKLIKNFQKVYTPGRTFCVDESIVPFQGRLIFKQYIPQKTHKYGVKLFKLCGGNGYTWNLRIYAGKETREGNASVPTNIVINLSKDLLNSGRTIIADNYYTSLELTNILLENKTHYIGTLRANRRGNPKDVILKKLKRGEVFGQENEKGVCVLKWKDKRDVLLLTTKHTTETVAIQRRSGVVHKPKAIIEYNKGKSSIDQSDQMTSYNSSLRKSLKWYRKLAIEFILGTAVVNSHIIYNQLANKKVKITEFREELVRSLLTYDEINDDESETTQSTSTKSAQIHKLLKKEGPFNKARRYCRGCYAKKTSWRNIQKSCKKSCDLLRYLRGQASLLFGLL